MTTTHAIEGLLRTPPDRWMTNTRVTGYQALLLNEPKVTFQLQAVLNPATLLPEVLADHPRDCREVLT